MRFPESSGKQRMKFCQGRNKPRQRREASPSRTLSEHVAETKIEQRTIIAFPGLAFFSSPFLAVYIMIFFFFPSMTISEAAGAVFVNTPQKCCGRGQGQVPPEEGWPRFHVSCRSMARHGGFIWRSRSTGPALPAGMGRSLGAKQCNCLLLG